MAVDVDPTAGTITLRPAARQDSGMAGVGGDNGVHGRRNGRVTTLVVPPDDAVDAPRERCRDDSIKTIRTAWPRSG
jgi:hypothetical protein